MLKKFLLPESTTIDCDELAPGYFSQTQGIQPDGILACRGTLKSTQHNPSKTEKLHFISEQSASTKREAILLFWSFLECIQQILGESCEVKNNNIMAVGVPLSESQIQATEGFVVFRVTFELEFKPGDKESEPTIFGRDIKDFSLEVMNTYTQKIQALDALENDLLDEELDEDYF